MNENLNNIVVEQNVPVQPVTPQPVMPQTENIPPVAPQPAAGREPIIVKGIDVSQYSAQDIPEDLVDEMSDEQADKYLALLTNEEDIQIFNEKYGYFESMPMSEEELNERRAARDSMKLSFGGGEENRSSQPQAPVAEAQPVKTEQTGSVIFGERQ